MKSACMRAKPSVDCSQASQRKAAAMTRKMILPMAPQLTSKKADCTTAISQPSGTMPCGISRAQASQHMMMVVIRFSATPSPDSTCRYRMNFR